MAVLTRIATGLVAAATLAAWTPAPAEDAARKPIDARTMWGLERVGAPALSPDGAYAVVPVTRYDIDKDKGLTDLWRIPTAGGEARRLTSHTSSESSPVWSPDGRYVAFVAKRDDDEQAQLYVLPTDGGEARRLTEVPTGVLAPKWFPDSKRLAFLSRVWTDLDKWEDQKKRMKERDESKVSAKVWNKPTARYWDSWIDDREAHLYTIALDGGEPVAVTRGTGVQLSRETPGADGFDIAPDGSEIAVVADVDPTGVDSNTDVFVVPAAGGAPRNLTAGHPGPDFRPLYSPDGRHLAFGRQMIKGFYGDKQRLMVLDRATLAVRELFADFDRSFDEVVWAGDGRALYASIGDAGVDRLYRLGLDEAAPRPITRTPSFSAIDVAGSPEIIVALRQSLSEPPTLVAVDPAGGSDRKLSTFNDAALAAFEFGRYESVTYPGAGGADIQMWVTYPPGFDPQNKYPLFVLIHGGPHNGIMDGWHWRWNAQVFSSWGYVTAWPNFHGSSGFGQAFTDSINPNRADLPYEDVVRAAEWLAAKPYIDRDRMAAGGGSYGGYLACVLLGREHPFRTLIAHAAVYNSLTQYAADYGAGKRRHGEHWEDPQSFLKYSPHSGAANFRTPTLVIHGGNDFRVPYNHGVELFNTLHNRGVPSRLVFYPDENHWILKPQNSIHWYGTVHDWLKVYLEGDGSSNAAGGM